MMATILPALIAALATIIAAWLSRPQPQSGSTAQPTTLVPQQPGVIPAPVSASSLSDLKYFNKSWKDPYKMLY